MALGQGLSCSASPIRAVLALYNNSSRMGNGHFQAFSIEVPPSDWFFHGHLRHDAFQIAYLFDVAVYFQCCAFVLKKPVGHVVARHDFSYIQQGHQQPFAHKAPMALEVWSSTSSSDLPESWMHCTNSRLRMVKRSSHINSLDGSRWMELMCPVFLFWVAPQVMQDGTADLSIGVIFYPKALEILHLKGVE